MFTWETIFEEFPKYCPNESNIPFTDALDNFRHTPDDADQEDQFFTHVDLPSIRQEQRTDYNTSKKILSDPTNFPPMKINLQGERNNYAPSIQRRK